MARILPPSVFKANFEAAEFKPTQSQRVGERFATPEGLKVGLDVVDKVGGTISDAVSRFSRSRAALARARKENKLGKDTGMWGTQYLTLNEEERKLLESQSYGAGQRDVVGAKDTKARAEGYDAMRRAWDRPGSGRLLADPTRDPSRLVSEDYKRLASASPLPKDPAPPKFIKVQSSDLENLAKPLSSPVGQDLEASGVIADQIGVGEDAAALIQRANTGQLKPEDIARLTALPQFVLHQGQFTDKDGVVREAPTIRLSDDYAREALRAAGDNENVKRAIRESLARRAVSILARSQHPRLADGIDRLRRYRSALSKMRYAAPFMSANHPDFMAYRREMEQSGYGRMTMGGQNPDDYLSQLGVIELQEKDLLKRLERKERDAGESRVNNLSKEEVSTLHWLREKYGSSAAPSSGTGGSATTTQGGGVATPPASADADTTQTIPTSQALAIAAGKAEMPASTPAPTSAPAPAPVATPAPVPTPAPPVAPLVAPTPASNVLPGDTDPATGMPLGDDGPRISPLEPPPSGSPGRRPGSHWPGLVEIPTRQEEQEARSQAARQRLRDKFTYGFPRYGSPGYDPRVHAERLRRDRVPAETIEKIIPGYRNLGVEPKSTGTKKVKQNIGGKIVTHEFPTYKAMAVGARNKKKRLPAVSAKDKARRVNLLRAAAKKYKIDPDLYVALADQESKYHDKAVSDQYAIGLTQMTPSAWLDIGGKPEDFKTLFDESVAAESGAKFLHLLRKRLIVAKELKKNDPKENEKIMAVYNAGLSAFRNEGFEKNSRRSKKTGKLYSGLMNPKRSVFLRDAKGNKIPLKGKDGKQLKTKKGKLRWKTRDGETYHYVTNIMKNYKKIKALAAKENKKTPKKKEKVVEKPGPKAPKEGT